MLCLFLGRAACAHPDPVRYCVHVESSAEAVRGVACEEDPRQALDPRAAIEDRSGCVERSTRLERRKDRSVNHPVVEAITQHLEREEDVR